MDRDGLAQTEPGAAFAERLSEAERAIAELERTNARLARGAMARFDAGAGPIHVRLERAQAALERAHADLEHQRGEAEVARAAFAGAAEAAAAERERLSAEGEHLAAVLEDVRRELVDSQADAAAAWGRYLDLRNRRAVRMTLGVTRRLGR